MELANKNVLILGGGISGQGAYTALKGICNPYFYVAEDFIECGLQNIRPKNDIAPDLIVTSPGIAFHKIIDYAYTNNIPVISELELGYLINNSPVVAITGTNGKTTVTRLVGDILSKQFCVSVCGNIGNAFSICAKEKHQIAVVEASSFQLERCYEFKPHIAVITNITVDHLDRHATMENYTNIKLRISQNQNKDDYLILPSKLKDLTQGLKSKIIFSDIDCEIKNDQILFFGEHIINTEQIKLIGNHNLQNVMQAICVSKLLHISNKNIAQAIENFVLDPHRLYKCAYKLNKNWFNDSKATNIDSCIQACLSMKGKTALILGGSDKGYSYDELFLNLPKNICEIFVFGQVANKLIESAKRQNTSVIRVENLHQAVLQCAEANVENVLLAPATASFDMYKDYKERGGHFEKLVQSL